MRTLAGLFLLLFGLQISAASAQSCTGLCLQQVACPNGGTTSISGIVYAPNGVDPLPDVTVYVPNDVVPSFTAGVSCPVVGAPPPGSPLVGTTTAADGSFSIPDMPVGTAIPLVIVTGRWRRQITVDTSAGTCINTPIATGVARMPRTHAEGDIPLFAVATGSADSVECVLRKVGIADSEFTLPGDGGRVNLYLGTGSPGASSPITTGGATTPTAHVIMDTSANLNAYDVLMLPCEGGEYETASEKTTNDYANLITFANSGGRVYSSHYSYSWMINNPPFSTVATWTKNQSTNYTDPGPATVDVTFSQGKTLSLWLNAIGVSTTNPAQISISTLKKDFNAIVAPTQSWLTLNQGSKPVMQFVFDTPVGATANQCGRVLYNEYHVENPVITSPGKTFPYECQTDPTQPIPAMTNQEKLLEYSLFALTSDGNAATLTPSTADFGSEPIGFTTNNQIFTWTNNSTFTASVSLLNASGDFVIGASNCGSVASGNSCSIPVAFAPTALGPRTGILTVGAAGSTLTANLTGTGTPGLTLGGTALSFPNTDVGGHSTMSLTLTNNAPGALPYPPFATTGDFSVGTTCAANVPALSTCSVQVTFSPTTSGPRTGILSVNSTNAVFSGLTANLSGNGIDYTFTVSPTSGTVVAGLPVTLTTTITPLAGYIGNVQFACSTNAPASTCTVGNGFLVNNAAANSTVTITTTSHYTVIGYGGLGAKGLPLLALFALLSGGLLWLQRKRSNLPLRATLALLLLATATASLTGCGGKDPATNSVYTPPGDYTYTVTCYDGIISHSATFALHVNAL